MLRFLGLIFILSVSPKVCSQSVLWKRLNSDKRFSHVSFTCIVEQDEHTLLLGTLNGLFRYDGRQFSSVPTSKNQHQPFIKKIFIDRLHRNKVFLITRNGLWRYDHQKSRIFPAHRFPQNLGELYDMTWDEKQQCYYLGSTLGVFRMDRQGKLHHLKSSHTNAFCTFSHVRGKLFVNTFNELYLITGDKLSLYRKIDHCFFMKYAAAKGQWIIHSYNGLLYADAAFKKVSRFRYQPQNKNRAFTQNILVDSENRIWFNNVDTLFVFRSPTDRHPEIHTWKPNKAQSLSGDIVHTYEDSHRNIWVSTNGNGLNLLPAKMRRVCLYDKDELGVSNIWTGYLDEHAKVKLFGTSDGICVEQNGQVKKIPNPGKLSRFTVCGIKPFDHRRWMVLTFGNGAWLLDKQTWSYSSYNRNWSQVGDFDIHGPDTILTSNSGVYKISSPEKDQQLLPYSSFTTLNIGPGKYLVGAHLGIYIWDQGKISKPEPLNSTVISLFKSNTICYAGSMDRGLFAYDLHRQKLYPVPLKNKPDCIYSISEFDRTMLLITSNKGLIMYDPKTGKSKVLNTQNYLPFDDFNQYGAYSNSSLYLFCGAHGVLYMDNNSISKLFQHMASIRVFNGNNQVDRLELAAGENKLALRAGIGLNSSGIEPDFRYRIRSLENEWHSSKNGTITYSYLPTGSYQLEIKINDPNGILAAKSRLIPVTIHPYWYESKWFYAVLIAGFTVLVYLISKYLSQLQLKRKIKLLEMERKINEERVRIARELHDNVGSQITYLINGLENSGYMLKQGKMDALQDNMENLQVNARESLQQLRDAVWALNTDSVSIEKLIARVEAWLEKMLLPVNIRLELHTTYERNIELDPVKVLNIFRIIQESANNAIKYSGTERLEVRLILEGNMLQVSIRDFGKGFDLAQADGNGLYIIRSRAKAIGAELKMGSSVNDGTGITIFADIS